MSMIEEMIKEQMADQSFDWVSVGSLCLETDEKKILSYQKKEGFTQEHPYFDLASLTKPFTCGIYSLANPQKMNTPMKLLLNHQSGLPAWGRLSRHNWEQQVLNYPIKKSETNYSDLGYLRLQLEIEKFEKHTLQELVSEFWGKGISYWQELNKDLSIVKSHQASSLRVHDDNAYNLKKFCSHAGLFGTAHNVLETISRLNKELNLTALMRDKMTSIEDRFVNGWDRVHDTKTTLAGDKASTQTFGHLGFTGTSVWVDLEKMIASVVLTNKTIKYWYANDGLNALRRALHNACWSKQL